MPADESVTYLLGKLESEIESIRQQAIHHLAQRGDAVMPQLIQAIKAKPRRFDTDSVQVFTGADTPFHEEMRQSNRRAGVAQILGEIGDPRALRYLERMVDNEDESEFVQKAADEAIERILEKNPGLAESEEETVIKKWWEFWK
ncbi:MAG: HEAT repeat domain-containing protein [Chloroflexota bacterium]|nr:HEAT repeat domain-containing protein [Chloroflexota bacterium]